MNASRPPFSTAVRSSLLAGACLIVAGCAGVPFTDAKIDPASPVAADVAKMTRQPGKLPTFASIPAPPKDLRPVAQYGRDARAVLAEGEALVAATAPSTWTLGDTEAFAERGRKDAGPQLDPPTPGDAEAFARALRERATPPPPR
jgi:hypothetical protein